MRPAASPSFGTEIENANSGSGPLSAPTRTAMLLQAADLRPRPREFVRFQQVWRAPRTPSYVLPILAEQRSGGLPDHSSVEVRLA